MQLLSSNFEPTNCWTLMLCDSSSGIWELGWDVLVFVSRLKPIHTEQLAGSRMSVIVRLSNPTMFVVDVSSSFLSGMIPNSLHTLPVCLCSHQPYDDTS